MNIIKIVLSFIFIIFVTVISQWIVTKLNIKFPGHLLGMMLLTALMYFKIVDIKFIELSGQFFLKHISLFFIPLLVGAISYLFKAEDDFLIIFIVFLITTIMLIFFTGLTIKYLLIIKTYKKKNLKFKEK